MNYVAFIGITEIDNLYFNSVRNMKGKIIVQNDEYKKKIVEYLKYEKKDSIDQSVGFFNAGEYDRPHSIRLIVFSYWVIKLIYKVIYFYLLPYMIIPLSYYQFIGIN